MFDRILVPLDGSELSSQILWQVRKLLLSEDAQLELYTVVDVWRESQQQPQIEDARRSLEELQKKLADEGARATVVVETGDPADMILDRVERTKPGLVAMATHGRSGPSRWLRGSVAQRVLRECRSPLLLVNPGAVEDDDIQGIRFKTILAPLDGSERSASILPLVRQVAATFESDVVLQNVWGPPLDDSPEAGEAMRAALEPARRELEGAGIEVRTRTGCGSPAEEILIAVEEEAADLVALATHGSSGLARWFYGSVTEKVLRRCPQPLLVINTRPVEEPSGA